MWVISSYKTGGYIMKLIIEENEQKMSESAMHILLGANMAGL